MALFDLFQALSCHSKLSRPVALSWAWRILNEYPEPLRLAAEAWARGEKDPDAEIDGFDLRTLRRITVSDVPEALELLYVLSRDRSTGLEMVSWFRPRDGRR